MGQNAVCFVLLLRKGVSIGGSLIVIRFEHADTFQ